MSETVPTEEIERIVGAERHATSHIGRVVGARFFILHSQECKDTTEDLRECRYSQAMDRGFSTLWNDYLEKPYHLFIVSSGRLVPLEEA